MENKNKEPYFLLVNSPSLYQYITLSNKYLTKQTNITKKN